MKERSWSSTVSMVQRRHQQGELIFAEEFHTLDPNIWEHEITVAGKTVSDSSSSKYILYTIYQ